MGALKVLTAPGVWEVVRGLPGPQGEPGPIGPPGAIDTSNLLQTASITAATNWGVAQATLYKLVFGTINLVFCEAMFTNNTGAVAANGATIGTVPTGYRPSADRFPPAINSSPAVACRWQVMTTGEIRLNLQPAGSELAAAANTRVSCFWAV